MRAPASPVRAFGLLLRVRALRTLRQVGSQAGGRGLLGALHAGKGPSVPGLLRGTVLGIALLLLGFMQVHGMVDRVLRRLGQGADISRAGGFFMEIVGLLALGCLFTGLSGKEMLRREWEVESLATLPQPVGVTLALRVCERALSHPLAGIVLWPLGTLLAWHAAVATLPPILAAALAPMLGLLATVLLMLPVAALQTIVEVWLRTTLSWSGLRNARAVIFVAALVSVGLPFYLASSRRSVGELVAAAPPWLALIPPGLFVEGVIRGGLAGLGRLGLLLLEGSLLTALLLVWTARLARRGLIARSAVESAQPLRPARVATSRRPTRVVAGGPSLVRAIVGRELRLLVRDRDLLVRTTIVPALLVGLQAFTIFRSRDAFSAHMTAELVPLIAFALGSFILLFAVMPLLQSDGPALPTMFTLPIPQGRLLLLRLLLWSALAELIALATVVCALTLGVPLGSRSAPGVLVAMVSLPIFATLAAAFGVLGWWPPVPGEQPRARVTDVYLFGLLGALHSFSMLAGQIRPQLVSTLLCAMLALALWRKASERLRFLLDPDARPRVVIPLLDGSVATLLFLALQPVAVYLLGRWGWLTAGAREPAAYGLAALLVWLGLRLVAWRRRARAAAPPADPSTTSPRLLGASPVSLLGLARSIALASVAGAAAGLLALAARTWLARSGLPLAPPHPATAFLPTTVALPLLLLAQPYFEELLFRGLVFQGLQPFLPRRWAVLASAALFAGLQPWSMAAPVFALGCICALLLARTRMLLVPVVAHAVYNVVTLVL